MKKLSLIFLFIFALSLSACGAGTIIIDDSLDDDTTVGDDLGNQDNPDNDIPNDTDTDEDGPPADLGDGEEDDEDSQTANPETGNIIVESPTPDETVTSPFEITGQAKVFEGTVLVRLRNQDGKIVVPVQIVNVHAEEAGEFGSFKIKINYQFYATKEGTVEVYSEDARDGSEINMVEVPVKFE
ncbi:hypothetical protein HQ544_02360 [Candidatus Falkowbacteria bacterium]|nr:hypothetical protein [Candidatus Falkowbacteria bacterium]